MRRDGNPGTPSGSEREKGTTCYRQLNSIHIVNSRVLLEDQVKLDGGLEQPNANWESPSDSAGSTGGPAAGKGGKRYIRLLGECGVIAQKL